MNMPVVHRRVRGQTSLEYLLLLAVVAVVVIAGFGPGALIDQVHNSSQDYYNTVADVIMGANPAPINGGWCTVTCPNTGITMYGACECPPPAFGGTCPSVTISCLGNTRYITQNGVTTAAGPCAGKKIICDCQPSGACTPEFGCYNTAGYDNCGSDCVASQTAGNTCTGTNICCDVPGSTLCGSVPYQCGCTQSSTCSVPANACNVTTGLDSWCQAPCPLATEPQCTGTSAQGGSCYTSCTNGFCSCTQGCGCAAAGHSCGLDACGNLNGCGRCDTAIGLGCNASQTCACTISGQTQPGGPGAPCSCPLAALVIGGPPLETQYVNYGACCPPGPNYTAAGGQCIVSGSCAPASADCGDAATGDTTIPNNGACSCPTDPSHLINGNPEQQVCNTSIANWQCCTPQKTCTVGAACLDPNNDTALCGPAGGNCTCPGTGATAQTCIGSPNGTCTCPTAGNVWDPFTSACCSPTTTCPVGGANSGDCNTGSAGDPAGSNGCGGACNCPTFTAAEGDTCSATTSKCVCNSTSCPTTGTSTSGYICDAATTLCCQKTSCPSATTDCHVAPKSDGNCGQSCPSNCTGSCADSTTCCPSGATACGSTCCSSSQECSSGKCVDCTCGAAPYVCSGRGSLYKDSCGRYSCPYPYCGAGSSCCSGSACTVSCVGCAVCPFSCGASGSPC